MVSLPHDLLLALRGACRSAADAKVTPTARDMNPRHSFAMQTDNPRGHVAMQTDPERPTRPSVTEKAIGEGTMAAVGVDEMVQTKPLPTPSHQKAANAQTALNLHDIETSLKAQMPPPAPVPALASQRPLLRTSTTIDPKPLIPVSPRRITDFPFHLATPRVRPPIYPVIRRPTLFPHSPSRQRLQMRAMPAPLSSTPETCSCDGLLARKKRGASQADTGRQTGPVPGPVANVVPVKRPHSFHTRFHWQKCCVDG